MKFVSPINPVDLSSDPIVHDEGDIYFNSSSSTLRLHSQGVWVSLLDENNHLTHTGNIIKLVGDDSTVSFSSTLDESFDNSTVYARSASPSEFIIGYHQNHPYRLGTQVRIVRAGNGSITIEPQTASVIIHTPSSSYLTFIGDSVNIINISENEWIIDGPFRDIY